MKPTLVLIVFMSLNSNKHYALIQCIICAGGIYNGGHKTVIAIQMLITDLYPQMRYFILSQSIIFNTHKNSIHKVKKNEYKILYHFTGHWVGDPCEFGHLTVQVLGNKYDTMLEDHGDKHLDQESLCWGLTAGFGSTLSQAHNQGWYMDSMFFVSIFIREFHAYNVILFVCLPLVMD